MYSHLGYDLSKSTDNTDLWFQNESGGYWRETFRSSEFLKLCLNIGILTQFFYYIYLP